jgi:hypothetical protein
MNQHGYASMTQRLMDTTNHMGVQMPGIQQGGYLTSIEFVN